jgi:hypothetical protein
MADKPPVDIRGTLLAVISEQQPKDRTDGSLQSGSVLRETARRIGAAHNIELEQALLSQLHDLFRTGYLAWGLNIANPNPPFFHVTENGRRLLARLTRDPANPTGYKSHLYAIATVNDVARSYIEESIECYVSGLYKAAAVMVGASAESLILELRDSLVSRLAALSRKTPKDLEDWRVKRTLDAMHGFLSANKGSLSPELREEFEAYWSAFSQQIRAIRNDVGHPSSVDPVTPDAVHASLLIYPELAKLQNKLLRWVNHDLM